MMKIIVAKTDLNNAHNQGKTYKGKKKYNAFHKIIILKESIAEERRIFFLIFCLRAIQDKINS